MLLAALAPLAGAHFSRDHGAVTIHDAEDGDPTDAVSCEFWVQGSGMSHENGTLTAIRSLGQNGIDVVELGEWEGVAEDGGTFSFVAGPFTLDEEGDWFVFANMDGQAHRSDSDTFSYAACEDDDETGGGDDGTAPTPPTAEVPFFPTWQSLGLALAGVAVCCALVVARRRT